MRAKSVNETIKHLAPRSEEEIDSLLNNMTDKDLFVGYAEDRKNLQIQSEIIRRGLGPKFMKFRELFSGKMMKSTTAIIEKYAEEALNEAIKHLSGKTKKDIDDIYKILRDKFFNGSKLETSNGWKIGYIPESKAAYIDIPFDGWNSEKEAKHDISLWTKNENDITGSYIEDTLKEIGYTINYSKKLSAKYFKHTRPPFARVWFKIRPIEINEAIKHLKPRPQSEIIANEEKMINSWIENGNIVGQLKDYLALTYENHLSSIPEAAPNVDKMMVEFYEEDGYADPDTISDWLLHQFDKKLLVKEIKNFLDGFREYMDAGPDPNKYGNE